MAACLGALLDFEEVIVVLDDLSSDESETICKSFPNVKVCREKFIGFGPMKNLAASLASKDWIFSMDTDEIASEALVDRMQNADLQSDTVYAFLRDNCYQGKVIKACGWENDYPIRLFNRSVTRFTEAKVHEAIKTEGMKVVKWQETILHLAYDQEIQLQHKAERYSSLYGEQHFRIKHVPFWQIPLKTAFTFFKDFVLRRGFLYGKTGWMIASYNALGVKLKYQKLQQLNDALQTSLIISTYNRPDALKAVLDSVVNQVDTPFEVLIADDGSTSDTKELVNQYAAKLNIHHIWHEDQGFRLSAIRNKAINAAKGDFICVIDGDMVLHPRFVKDVKRHAMKGQYLQGKRVLLSEKTTSKILTGEINKIHIFTSGVINRINTLSIPVLSDIFSPFRNHIRGTRGCSMDFWKEDLELVNGYNEDIQGWGREDSELALRLQNAGIKRKNVVLGAVAYHLWHKEAKRDQLQDNDKVLEMTQSNSLTWCDNGLIDGRDQPK